MTFLCDIPGVDAATAAWHSIVHLGLTVVVTLSGTGFLARAVVVYRRTAPAAASSARTATTRVAPRLPDRGLVRFGSRHGHGTTATTP